MHSHRLLTLACASVLLCATSPTWAGSFLDRIKERVQERRAAQDPGAAAQHSDTPEPPGHHTPSVRDLAYGSDPRQRMDVYLPAKPVNAPVILMVHGGGWRWGDKESGAVVDNKVARWVALGFVSVSVNNRLLPQANPLEQARDVAQALAVAQAKAPTWGAEPWRKADGPLRRSPSGGPGQRVTGTGPSGRAKAWLGTVALDSVVADVTPIMQGSHLRLYDAAVGTDPAFWRAVSPLQQLTASAKPMLAVCSSRRSDACAQADVFAERAAQLGVRAQVLRQDLSHRDINQSLGLAGAYTDAVEAFMASLDPAVAKVLATPQTPAPAKLSQP